MAVFSGRVESEISIISRHIRLFYSDEAGEDSSMTGVINKLAFAGRERQAINKDSECPEIFLTNLNEVNSIC